MKATEQRKTCGKYQDIPVLGRVLRAKDTVKRMYMVWKMQREAKKALKDLAEPDVEGDG